VGLDLVQRQLLFPPLVVDQRGLARRQVFRVGQVGDQPMPFTGTGAVGVLVGVLDDPDREAAQSAAAVGLAGVDLGQERAVGEASDRPRDGVTLDPREQVGAPPDDCGDEI
jgi:hypothetical protein